MPGIFISYRRDDSPHVVGRIHDRLTREFGDDAVFVDVVNVPLGKDFVEGIDCEVANCDVLLAVIGPKWLKILRSRQNAADDFVRIEIESALRQGKPVIPLEVDDGKIPSETELPHAMQKLANLQGMPIRAGHDFDGDIARLTNGLVALGLQQIIPEPEPEPDPVKAARLQHIASILARLIENDDVLSPSNYSVPLRLLLSDEIRNKTGITGKSDSSVIVGEVGSELYMLELHAAFEAAFDKDLDISLDSSVTSIYSEIFDD